MTGADNKINSNPPPPPQSSTKKSLFERQRDEAEAKRLREQAETAAVLEDFVKSFDHDESTTSTSNTQRRQQDGAGGGNNVFGRGGGGGGGGGVGGPGKRHFTSSGLKSGPGSLGPSPGTTVGGGGIQRSGVGSLGRDAHATPGRKRAWEDYQGFGHGHGSRAPRDRDRDGAGMFSYEEDDRRDSTSHHAPQERDQYSYEGEANATDATEDKAAAKPTLHLSSLPPGTSPAVVRALFVPSPLVVENVRILPPPPPPPPSQHASSAEPQKSTTAIVTLTAETPATDIDTVVSALQNRYVGFGFHLSISRHLSSAALTSSGGGIAGPPTSTSTTLPFNARPIAPQSNYPYSLSRAPPPGHSQQQNRFAPPPASYTSSTPYSSRSNASATQVVVTPPTDLPQLRLIHKTLEALLTHGAEFEALLMSLPAVQRDEKWAWLFDARSAGGVYYRWRLWETVTRSAAAASSASRGRRRSDQRRTSAGGLEGAQLFEGQSVWIPPERGLKFEYTTQLEEFVSDADYDSSDEEDDDGGIARRYNDHNRASGGPPPLEGVNESDGTGYLNPLAQTKLVHLLARLPESNAKLRRGDVARVTGFAIEHAGSGASEVAEMITANVARPFSTTRARGSAADSHDDDDGDENNEDEKPTDHSAASLVGLYVISDILSSSASAGVRHAWRYRALFETALREQATFARLGRMDKELGWGKLKAEKWKRSVQGILSLWEGWCVFPQASHEEFLRGFLEPPLTRGEKDKEREEAELQQQDKLRKVKGGGGGSNSKWKTLDERTASQDVAMEDVDGRRMSDDGEDDVDGQPMDEDDDMVDENIDGVSMADSSDEGADEEEEQVDAEPAKQTPGKQLPPPAPVGLLNPRQRPRAVDMFADEDSGGE